MTGPVFILGTESNQYLVIRSEIEYFRHHFIGKPMQETWVPPSIRILNKSKPLPDFVSWLTSAPVISAKGRDALYPVLHEHCEILPLTDLRGKPYFAVNVLTSIDCFDAENSDVTYSSEDPTRIIYFGNHHLHADRIPPDVPIFKVPEDAGSVFVTQPFVDVVISDRLRGAAFMDPHVNAFHKIMRGEPLNVVAGLPN